jgi:predicted ester cyclase
MQTPDGEIPATGNSIEMRACVLFEVEDDKVKSIRQYFDMMTMMQQLGLAG